MPACTVLSGCVYPVTRTLILRSVRKFVIYYDSNIGIFLFRRLCVSLACETLSNALATSRLSSVVTLGLFPAILYVSF